MSLIEIRNVSKLFGKTYALRNVSLTLEPNKIYGLLGRNGAGKTTLINIITNKLFPSAGEVFIDGENAVENDNAQSKIFCMNEKNIYPLDMKVKEGFSWTKEFYPDFDMDYAEGLAKTFELNPLKKIKELSTGYNSIFKLILTLSSCAPVIIFDEPILGLDANHREIFYRELITNYSEHPKTVVVSTHLIDEISDLLEELIIIKYGEIILTQTVDSLLQSAYTVSGDSANVDKYTLNKKVIREETFGRLKSATIYQRRTEADNIVVKKLGLEIVPVKLQELFVSLTNS